MLQWALRDGDEPSLPEQATICDRLIAAHVGQSIARRAGVGPERTLSGAAGNVIYRTYKAQWSDAEVMLNLTRRKP